MIVSGTAAATATDSEGVTQPLGGSGRSFDLGRRHHRAHPSPGSRARPRPKCGVEPKAGAAQLQASERFEQPSRHRDGPEDATATLFERFKDYDARRRIDPVGCEGERLE